MTGKYKWLWIGLVLLAGLCGVASIIVWLVTGNKGAGFVGLPLVAIVIVSNAIILIRQARGNPSARGKRS